MNEMHLEILLINLNFASNVSGYEESVYYFCSPNWRQIVQYFRILAQLLHCILYVYFY